MNADNWNKSQGIAEDPEICNELTKPEISNVLQYTVQKLGVGKVEKFNTKSITFNVFFF